MYVVLLKDSDVNLVRTCCIAPVGGCTGHTSQLPDMSCYCSLKLYLHTLELLAAAEVDAAEPAKRVKTEGDWTGTTNGTTGQ